MDGHIFSCDHVSILRNEGCVFKIFYHVHPPYFSSALSSQLPSCLYCGIISARCRPDIRTRHHLFAVPSITRNGKIKHGHGEPEMIQRLLCFLNKKPFLLNCLAEAAGASLRPARLRGLGEDTEGSEQSCRNEPGETL